MTSSAPLTPVCNTDMLALLVIGSILWLADLNLPTTLRRSIFVSGTVP